VWDVVADTVTWSDQLYAIFGRSPDTFTPSYEGYLQCLHEDDRPLARHNVERALGHHEPYAADYRVAWPDGEVRWVHCRGRAAIGDDGRVVQLLGTAQDISDRKVLEAQLVHRALHDDLTGLPNRSLVVDRLAHAMQRTERTRRHTLALFVDLDGFKAVNDRGGHEAGDEALRVIGRRLRDCVRQHDTVGRYGGDEFVVVAEEVRWPGEAARLAERVLDAASQPFEHLSAAHAVSASVGGTIATTGRTPDEVLRNADAAMYEAKARGGNAVAWVDAPGAV